MPKDHQTELKRSLIFIDIENLVGGAKPTLAELEYGKQQLRSVIEGFDTQLAIVASSHLSALAVAQVFPDALLRWRSGPDGADLALIDEMRDLRVMQRFDQIVLCSGDGIFAPYLAAMAGHGIDTTVVGLEGHVSAKLKLAARRLIMLSSPTSVLGSAS